MMTDASKVNVWAATWLPFGAAYNITGTAANDTRFPGQWFQVETGLNYNWNRHYDPTRGRYTQADPLGLIDGPSVYAYALSNPQNNIDPTGEQASRILGGRPSAAGRGGAGRVLLKYLESETELARLLARGLLMCLIPDLDTGNVLEARGGPNNQTPTWIDGRKPEPGQSGREFADKEMNERYGEGNYQKGPNSEHNKIRKYGNSQNKK